MKVFKTVGGVLAALIVALAVTFVTAKFSDGPIGIFPGGPLSSGEIVPHFIGGWGWARQVDTIEMQLADEQTSRTTWFIEHEARGFIPASVGFPPGKTWHERADGKKAWLRIEDKRYSVQLDRLDDAAVMAELKKKVERKYGRNPLGDSGVWWFAVQSLAPIPNF